MKLKKKKYSFLSPEKYKTGEALRGSAKPQERDADAGRAGHPPVSVSITVSRRQAAEPRAAADPARGQAAGNARQQTAAQTLPETNPADGAVETPAAPDTAADKSAATRPDSVPQPAAVKPGGDRLEAAAGMAEPKADASAAMPQAGAIASAAPEPAQAVPPESVQAAAAESAARAESSGSPDISASADTAAAPAQPERTQESDADIPTPVAAKPAAEPNPAGAAADIPAVLPDTQPAFAAAEAEQGRGGDSASPPSAPVPAVAAQPGNIQGNAAAGAEASSGAEAAADSGTNAAETEAAAAFVPVAPASPTTGLEAETAAAVDIPPADSFWRRLIAPANLAFLLLALLLMGPIYLVNYALGDLYYLHEDGEQVAVLFSRAQTDAAVFEQAGIALHEADRIDRAPFGDCTHLTVTRAFTVDVTADGETRTLRLLDKTTADALAQLGIRLEPDDLVDPPLTHRLVPGESVRVTRVRYETREALEEVPWQEVDKPSPLIAQGRTQVMNAGGGRDGLAQRVYRDKYVDGVLAQSELVEEQYEDFPWNVVTLVGDDDAVMSPLDGAAFTDVEIVDNAPTSYERVLENAVCTAYSFKPGTYGASGMYMFQGFVAVNTNVIPYGSLLYITSPTGQFTYGWAIAADVGEAMMAGYVDIDLFFETYTESALFGKHRMNVYVVDQLTQAELEQFMAQPGMFRSRIPAG